MSVSVGPIGAVNGGQRPYAVSSAYLNGVVRTSDAAAAAQADATAQATSAAVAQVAIAARAFAAAAATASPPFANPAITAIGERLALAQALNPATGVTPDALLSSAGLFGRASANEINVTHSIASFQNRTAPVPPAVAPDQLSATDSVLTGDGGVLVQSYGAVALLAGVTGNASVFAKAAATPLVTAPAIVARIPSVNAIA